MLKKVSGGLLPMRFHPFRTLPFAGAALVAVLMIPSGISRPVSRIKPFSAYDSQAKALLAKMTLDEKIGQMTQADLRGLKDISDIQKYYLGSVLSGGDSDPKAGNTLQDWTDQIDRITAEAIKTRLAIPLLYGIDAVHGHNNILGATIFPQNIGEGCAHNPELV